MEIEIEGNLYPIILTRKKNKNIYIRIGDNLEILVTAPYLVSNHSIYKMVEKNKDSVKKMLNKKKKERMKEEEFYYLGKKYDIIIVPTLDKIEIEGSIIYVPSRTYLEKWVTKEMKRLFKERLDFQYQRFIEDIPYPKLKIRKMKTRWGVCNKRDNSVTLNATLFKEKEESLDYVIIHELSHFIHFDHSKAFWQTVEKYCENYKKIRKELKE